jgi:rRNA processing protein Gar1
MDRYLESAALIVFISNGSIRDVFGTIQNHLIRKKYIDIIPEDQRNNLQEYIDSIKELDEVDKKTGEVTGTKLQSAAGIFDRLNKLKQNPYMELMLKKDCSNNINLVEEIQKSQLICLRMPEIMFSTETEKDIYCTYWMTKIWLALQIRKWEITKDKHIKVNIIVDELYQVPHCQDFTRSKLSQMAKFSGKMIISCHYLGQIGIIRDELKAANSSYMLISGCDKDNFKELKDELSPYTVEDLMNLKRYHSLNYMKYEKGYAKFISKLPKPIT